MVEVNERPEAETQRRHSMRLRGYDYSTPGAYFITICTDHRRPLFGNVTDGNMVLNQFGHVIENEWLRLPARFPSIEVGEFVVMPDHFHGLLWIIDPVIGISHDQDNSLNHDVEAGFTPAQGNSLIHDVEAGFTPASNGQTEGLPSIGQTEGLPSIGQPRGLPLLGRVIGAFKSLCVKGCLAVADNRNETLGKLWQRNYYEHIVHDENELQSIALYIQSNPAKWETDRLYPPENLHIT